MSFISNHMVNNFWCSSYLYVDPVSIWNHFPSVWRTSFNISPRAGPLANHSFIHCCMSEKSLFHLHKEILLLWISNLNGSCFTFFFFLVLIGCLSTVWRCCSSVLWLVLFPTGNQLSLSSLFIFMKCRFFPLTAFMIFLFITGKTSVLIYCDIVFFVFGVYWAS